MGWEFITLEGIAATAEQFGAGVREVISVTPVTPVIADNAVLETLKQLTGVDVSPYVNSAGDVVGYVAQKASSFNGTTAVSNSMVDLVWNAQTVTQEIIDAAIPLAGGGDSSTLTLGESIQMYAASAAAGVGGAAGTGVGATALATVAGPAIAAALGVASGVALYNIAPEFWTTVAERLKSAGKWVGVGVGAAIGGVLTFFDSHGNSYYDEQVINIIQTALIELGLLGNGTAGYYPPPSLGLDDKVPIPMPGSTGTAYVHDTRASKYDVYVISDQDVAFCVRRRSGTLARITAASESAGRVATVTVEHNNQVAYQSLTSTYTFDGKTVYQKSWNQNLQFGPDYISVPESFQSPGDSYDGPIGWTLIYGDRRDAAPVPNDLPKTDNGEGARVSPVDTSVTEPLMPPSTSPDYNPRQYFDPIIAPGTTDTPIPEPVTPPEADPTPQPNPAPLPNPYPQPQPTPSNPTTPPTDPPTTNPPGQEDRGDPPSPSPIVDIRAGGMFRVYNPSQSDVEALGAFLWSSTSVVDLLKIFQNPIDGIIGLFALFVNPTTGGSREIKLGYLPTGVSSPVVAKQVVKLECGSISIPLLKQNATDYPPYTTMQVYLPFIGIEPLNAYDFVGGTMTITYVVDCYTGTCVAQIYGTRDGFTSKLYEFSGNCAQQIPLTSGSFMSLAANVVSGIVTGAVHGGAVGAAIGAGSSLIHSNVEVGRSGNLSANAGLCGSRKPYVIITRAISADATNYSYFYGYPANKTVYLSNCRGYVRVKNIILHTSATEAEKVEIESLLKEGVYL